MRVLSLHMLTSVWCLLGCTLCVAVQVSYLVDCVCVCVYVFVSVVDEETGIAVRADCANLHRQNVAFATPLRFTYILAVQAYSHHHFLASRS